MSLTPAMIDAMVASGCTAEQMAAVMKAALADRDEKLAEKRAKDAERQRKSRVNRGLSRDVTVTECDERDATPFPAPSPSFPPDPQTNPTPTHTPVKTSRPRKADDFELPDRIPAEPWEAFVAMRSRIRKPLTAYAKQLAVKELDKLASDGWPPGDVLNNSTMNSYQGLVPPKGRNNDRHRNDRPAADPIRDPMARVVANRQAERACGTQAEPSGHASDWP